MQNPVLLDPDGRRLIAAQFMAQLGFGLALMALPWIILDQGGSKALSGLAATAGFLPYVVLGLFAGAIGDRVPRKRLMLLAYVCQAAAASAIPLYWLLTGPPPAGLILGVAFLVGCGRTFVDAAMFGAIADVVSPERFIEAQALLSVAWSSGQIFGPFAGGALIAAIGGGATLAVQTCCYIVGALVVLTIRRPLASHAAGAAEPILSAVRQGVMVLARVPILRLLSIVAFGWYICVMGTQTLLVAYYRNELGFDAHAVGATLATAGILGLIGGFALGPLSRRFGGARLIAAGVVVSGLAVLAIAAAQNLPSAVAAAGLLGFSVQVTVSSFIAERQRYAPRHLQSRVGLSGRAMVVCASTLGGLIGSGFAALISLRSFYAGAGLTTLALALSAVPAIFRMLSGARETQPAPASAR